MAPNTRIQTDNGATIVEPPTGVDTPKVQGFGLVQDGLLPKVVDNGDGTFSLHVVTDAGAATIGTVNQGTPNAGGANAWPVNSELPAAVALSDSTATPTAPAVGAFGFGWDPYGGAVWQRLRAFGDANDALGTIPAGVLIVDARQFGFNGTTYDRLRSDITNGLDVDVTRLPAGEIHLGEIGGKLVISSATITRPSNTTAYSAKTAITQTSATHMTFAGVARITQGSGYVVGCRAMTDRSAETTQIRIHLFHTAPSDIADGSAFTILWANRNKRIGHIDLPAFSTEGTGSDAAYASNFDVRLPFNCDSGLQDIYALVETMNGIASPASAQQFYFEISADQN